MHNQSVKNELHSSPMPINITLTSGRRDHARLDFTRDGIHMATYVGMFRFMNVHYGPVLTRVPVMHGQGWFRCYIDTDDDQVGQFTNGVFMDDTDPLFHYFDIHVRFITLLRTFLPVTHHPDNNYDEEYTDDTSNDEGAKDQSDFTSEDEWSEDEA